MASSRMLEVSWGPVLTGFVGWRQMLVQVVALHYVWLVANVVAV